MTITQAYFSPGGTTQAIAEYFTACLPAQEIRSVDLLRLRVPLNLTLGPHELLVINMPVFIGRLPQTCPDLLAGFKGLGAPAVAMVTYGNREYEDALLELCDLLNAGGFKVIGAAAFIARHSIFQELAAGRPDSADKQLISDFAARCAAKLTGPGTPPRLDAPIPGNRPYCAIQAHPLKPAGNERCTACGICAALCPTRAIAPDRPRLTDPERCITCTACIHNCPQNARAFRGAVFEERAAMFLAKFGARKEPAIFV